MSYTIKFWKSPLSIFLENFASYGNLWSHFQNILYFILSYCDQEE